MEFSFSHALNRAGNAPIFNGIGVVDCFVTEIPTKWVDFDG